MNISPPSRPQTRHTRARRTFSALAALALGSGLALAMTAVPASANIVRTGVIGDKVWLDTDGNGLQQAGERGVPHFPVRLTGTTASGATVNTATQTDDNGNYRFSNLEAGTYVVTFEPSFFVAHPQWGFTRKNAPATPAILTMVNGSDADPITGRTDPITLGVGESNLTNDAGILAPDISIAKRLVAQTSRDASGRTTLVYELTVTNAGTIGTYSLRDDLMFGADIAVLNASATAIAPTTVALNPAFDGLTSSALVTDASIGSDTHTIQVAVTAEVPTTLAPSAANCAGEDGEDGTGFLNFISATVNRASLSAMACAPVLGEFDLTKVVTASGVEIAPDQPFTVTYQVGEADPVTETLTAGNPLTVSDLPIGATVTITEAAPANTPAIRWLTPSFQVNGGAGSAEATFAVAVTATDVVLTNTATAVVTTSPSAPTTTPPTTPPNTNPPTLPPASTTNPGTPTTAAPTSPSAAASVDDELPNTGSDSTGLAALAAVLLSAGALLAFSRRRTAQQD